MQDSENNMNKWVLLHHMLKYQKWNYKREATKAYSLCTPCSAKEVRHAIHWPTMMSKHNLNW